MVPLGFLVVVMVVALRYGTVAGVIGSLVSATIFAFFLFTPVGSITIHDQAARSSIGWLLLGGITLSALFAPPNLGDSSKQ